MATTKTKTTKKTECDCEQGWTDDVREMGRKVWLTGLGAVATVEKETKNMFETLLERGEEYRDEYGKGESVIGEATDRIKEAGRTVEDGVTRAVSGTLHRIGVPTHDEISMLIDRVEKLTRKVEAMQEKSA